MWNGTKTKKKSKPVTLIRLHLSQFLKGCIDTHFWFTLLLLFNKYCLVVGSVFCIKFPNLIRQRQLLRILECGNRQANSWEVILRIVQELAVVFPVKQTSHVCFSNNECNIKLVFIK